MVDEVILHIGTHKTGSSSIQEGFQCFDDGTTRYAQLGYSNHSLPICTLFAEKYLQYHVWIKRGLSNVEIEAIRDKARQDLVAELCRPLTKRLIISGEGISLLSESEKIALLDFLKKYKVTIRVVCYLREPMSFAVSAFQESVKHGNHSVAPVAVKYRYKLLPFIDNLPAGSVTVKVFDKKLLARGDVYHDFCDIVGVRPAGYFGRVVNDSLTVPALKLTWAFNGAPVAWSGTRRLSAARARLLSSLRIAYSGFPKLDPMRYGHAVCSPGTGELSFVDQAFGIKFVMPFTEQKIDLAAYLSDLSDVDIDPLNKLLLEYDLDYSIYQSVEAMLIALYYRILEGGAPKLAFRDADMLRDIALKYDCGGVISVKDALDLLLLAKRVRPTGRVIARKIEEYASLAANGS